MPKYTDYEPYGAPATGFYEDGPGYTGHVTDKATGLSYMQQRYYDPVAGRFLSTDPVGVDMNAGGNFNRYWYANNNPYKFTDPDGRESGCIYGGGCGGMASDTQNAVFGAVLDFIPIAGDVKGIGEAIAAPTVVNVAAAVVGLVPVLGDAAAKGIKAIDKVADAAKVLPKPNSGPGAVAKADRDPKRFFSPSERETKRAEQGNQCGNGCGAEISNSNSAGHHIERHADGGRTTSENHAEVCLDCHKKLHSDG